MDMSLDSGTRSSYLESYLESWLIRPEGSWSIIAESWVSDTRARAGSDPLLLIPEP